MRSYEERRIADWLASSNEALPLLLRRNVLVRCDQIPVDGDGEDAEAKHRKIELDLKGDLGELVTVKGRN